MNEWMFSFPRDICDLDAIKAKKDSDRDTYTAFES